MVSFLTLAHLNDSPRLHKYRRITRANFKGKPWECPYMHTKYACPSGNCCTLKLPNVSRIPVIISDDNVKGKALYPAGGTRQHLLFADRQHSQQSSTGQELQNTNVSWTLEASWIGSGLVSPHGQREDLLSSHIRFVWGFFKTNKKRAGSCGQSMPLA